MSPVDYHGWTHAPKEQGGTDPIPFEVSASGIKPVYLKFSAWSGDPDAFDAGGTPLFPTDTNPVPLWTTKANFNNGLANGGPYIQLLSGKPYFRKTGVYDIKATLTIDPAASGALPAYEFTRAWFDYGPALSQGSGYWWAGEPLTPQGMPVCDSVTPTFGSSVSWTMQLTTMLIIFGAAALDKTLDVYYQPATAAASTQSFSSTLLITRIGDAV